LIARHCKITLEEGGTAPSTLMDPFSPSSPNFDGELETIDLDIDLGPMFEMR